MKSVLIRVVAVSALAAGLGVAPVRAWAEDASAEPTAAEIAVARRLFAEASALEKNEKWAEAEAKLVEVASIKETPGLRYHLGFCMEQQGKLVAALVEYDRASELLARGTKAPDVAELVGPAAARVRGRVAQLTVKLARAVDGAKVELDGSPVKLALIGRAMPANPGKHVVTASAPGHQAFRREIELTDAESEDVVITLVSSAPAAAGAASAGKAGPNSASAGPEAGATDEGAGSTSGSGSARTYVLIGEAAATVILLGVGIFYTIDKGNAQDQVDQADAYIAKNGGCKNPDLKDECAQRPDLVDQRDRAATLSTVGFIGAGVGAVATVTTFLLWKPSRKQQSAVWIAPVAAPMASPRGSPRGGGVAVGGRF